MKKSDILIILFGSLIVIACFIGYLYFHLNETVFYIICGITFATVFFIFIYEIIKTAAMVLNFMIDIKMA